MQQVETYHAVQERSVGALIWAGYKATVPMMVGVAPFGVVFGALAINNGMSPLQALGMSIFVLAGSSQFIAAGLIGQHTPILIIVFTTFIVNLRHFLYSASLADFFKPISREWKALLGYMMVDEVYAMVMVRHQKRDLSPDELKWFFFGSAANLISIWWTTTLIGAAVGNILPDNATDVLGFTLPLIFTAIVVPLLKERPALLTAVSAGVSGILLNPLPHKLGLIVAAFIGITVGVLAEQRVGRKPA